MAATEVPRILLDNVSVSYETPRGRLQVIMELEIKTAEDSRQAIMRGRKQMPLKVVPADSVPLDRHTNQVAFFGCLTLLVQN